MWPRGCGSLRSRSGRACDLVTAAGTAARGARAARGWQVRRANRRALARFGDFWAALQRVGDALADAEKAAKAADDTKQRPAGHRHWNVATAQEVRAAIKKCRASLRIVSAQAKRFEPELIVKDWRR